jgi:hypothetical protein
MEAGFKTTDWGRKAAFFGHKKNDKFRTLLVTTLGVGLKKVSKP